MAQFPGTDQYLFSGTVGDAYIALCKLAERARRNPCRLRRLERHPGADATIAAIAHLFPGVTYEDDFLRFATIADMRAHAFRHADRYLSIFWDRNGRGNEPNDSPDLIYTPFPELALPEVPSRQRPKRLGFQVHSGSRPGHLRTLDPAWIVTVCRGLHDAQIEVLLLGTGEGLTDADQLELSRVSGNCINLIDQTDLTLWMSYVKSLDFLVTTDGLAAFLALSQRVRTVVAFSEPEAILRFAPEWREFAVCMWPQESVATANGHCLSPIAPAQMVSMILAHLDPDALTHDAGRRPRCAANFVTA